MLKKSTSRAPVLHERYLHERKRNLHETKLQHETKSLPEHVETNLGSEEMVLKVTRMKSESSSASQALGPELRG